MSKLKPAQTMNGKYGDNNITDEFSKFYKNTYVPNSLCSHDQFACRVESCKVNYSGWTSCVSSNYYCPSSPEGLLYAVVTSDLKFHKFFCPEIFHEIFHEIF